MKVQVSASLNFQFFSTVTIFFSREFILSMLFKVFFPIIKHMAVDKILNITWMCELSALISVIHVSAFLNQKTKCI